MSFYLVDDIQQGTAKWLQWRKGVIGASEAAIIMGENRLKGRQQLIDEKRGLVEPFSGNAATREGQFLEDHARSALAKKYRVKLSPTIAQDIVVCRFIFCNRLEPSPNAAGEAIFAIGKIYKIIKKLTR